MKFKFQTEDIKKLCIDFDFDEDKIDEYIKLFEVDDKYKDVPAYQWQETLTREQKSSMRKKKQEDGEK